MRDFSERQLVAPHSVDGVAHTDIDFIKSLLAALKAHDRYTYRHSVRTVRMGLLLGRACGLAGAQLRTLCLGALLHDVGKVFVPERVLHKPGRLTTEEWATIKRHPQAGARLLFGVQLAAGALRVIAEHHERWDGRGYPVGVRGERIDINARVVAVADAFDAMTNARAYRPAMSDEAATGELERCAGTQFDPQVVAAFGRVARTRLKLIAG